MFRLVIWPSMTLLGWTETKLWTLKYGSKSIETSLILRQRPPKSYKLLKYFMISVILFKMSKHSDFHLIFFQIEGAWQDFTVVRKLIKNFKSLYGLGGRLLETFVWILNRISRSITWSLFTLKASYLVKWPISTWSFMWWCQLIDQLKFETRPNSPQFPDEFRSSQSQHPAPHSQGNVFMVCHHYYMKKLVIKWADKWRYWLFLFLAPN